MPQVKDRLIVFGLKAHKMHCRCIAKKPGLEQKMFRRNKMECAKKQLFDITAKTDQAIKPELKFHRENHQCCR